MRSSSSFIDIIDQTISDGVAKNLLHLYNDDECFDGNTITFNNRKLINFGSCSYLGLEFDNRLKESAKTAIDHFGTQFSASRAYISLGLYQKLESLFDMLFSAHCVIAPTTTLAHMANLPILIDDRDAVILDQQVHNSVQMATSILKARGVYTELLPHNCMDKLEERIMSLRSKYQKIWYLADGIYSMYGDCCNMEAITRMLNNYACFNFYVDDAHGMSIYGENGRGFVLSNNAIHPKMIVATSLAKAFATGGAVTVFPSKEMARKVRTCGGPLITSGPLQPANLGAAIAAASIHLSPEIHILQQELFEKISYTYELLKSYGLPVISKHLSSIFFIGVSLPKLGYNLAGKMLQAGHYVNLGIFPAVPLKNTGIRFTITRLHSKEQIKQMVGDMAALFPVALKEENMELQHVYQAFDIHNIEENNLDLTKQNISSPQKIRFKKYNTITQVDRVVWDNIFSDRGNFDYDCLTLLESVFSNSNEPENNWLFDYIIIKDQNGEIIVATYLTTTIWKDDMLSAGDVSAVVEAIRKDNPYYLTSKVISTGSLLTEGEHLYVNKTSFLWKEAILLLLDLVAQLQDDYKANSIIIRDFHGIDQELDTLLKDNGFFRMPMPDTHVIESTGWQSKEAYYNGLSKRSRQHFREDIRKHEDKYEIEIIKKASSEIISHWYQLYLNVKQHSLDLNTFTLPQKLFLHISENTRWETIILRLKEPFNRKGDNLVAVVWCYKTHNNYIPLIIGLNYTYNKQYKIYRQALYRIIMRANEFASKKVFMGFAATTEKRKLGAKAISTYAYMQYKNGYNLEVLSGLKTARKIITA